MVVWALFAVVFAFTDEAISDSVYKPESWWAGFLEAYGQLPGTFVGFLGGSLLLGTFEMKSGLRSTLAVVGLALAIAFAALGFVADVAGVQAGADVNPEVVGAGALVMILGTQLLLRLVPSESLEAWRSASKVALALLLVAGFATVWAIKIPWGRWTYRDILEAGDRALFSPWYAPQGVNGHYSFISGHTAISFAVLPIAHIWASSRRAFNAALAVGVAWGLLGALSRVVIGAHFASDTLFAAALTITWFAFFSRRFVEEAPDRATRARA